MPSSTKRTVPTLSDTPYALETTFRSQNCSEIATSSHLSTKIYYLTHQQQHGERRFVSNHWARLPSHADEFIMQGVSVLIGHPRRCNFRANTSSLLSFSAQIFNILQIEKCRQMIRSDRFTKRNIAYSEHASCVCSTVRTILYGKHKHSMTDCFCTVSNNSL